MNETAIMVYVAGVFVAGLVALAWMHWYTRDARRYVREGGQRRHPAE